MTDSDSRYDLLLDGQKKTAALIEDLLQDFRSLVTVNERLALLSHRLVTVEDYVKQLEHFKRECNSIRKECSAHFVGRLEEIAEKREKRGEEMYAIQTKCMERSVEIAKEVALKNSAIYAKIDEVRKELMNKLDSAIATSVQDRDSIREKADKNEATLRDKLAMLSTDSAGKFGKYAGIATILPLVVGLLMALLQIVTAHVLKASPVP